MELEVVLELLVILISLFAGADTGSSGSGNFTVSEVVDGDTVKVGDGRAVRLLGVDTPEVYSEVSVEEFDAENKSCLDSWGDKASDLAESKLSGRTVDIEFYGKGSYDRDLGVIFVGNQSFNRLLVEEGYARVYRAEDFGQKEEWIGLEEKAKRNDVGLWAC